jgi:hypothetical protein
MTLCVRVMEMFEYCNLRNMLCSDVALHYTVRIYADCHYVVVMLSVIMSHVIIHIVIAPKDHHKVQPFFLVVGTITEILIPLCNLCI